MTTKITLAKTRRGDLQLHVTGCGDLGHRSKYFLEYGEEMPVFEGADLAAAITEADTDMAAWFGELPYTESSRENGCWSSTNGVEHAPCLKAAIKSAGLVFEADGRPRVAMTPLAFRRRAAAAAATLAPVSARSDETRCRGKHSVCGGINDAKSAKWHLCQPCTDRRAAR